MIFSESPNPKLSGTCRIHFTKKNYRALSFKLQGKFRKSIIVHPKDLEHERMTNKKKLLSRVLLNILEVVLCMYHTYTVLNIYTHRAFFPESRGNHIGIS